MKITKIRYILKVFYFLKEETDLSNGMGGPN